LFRAHRGGNTKAKRDGNAAPGPVKRKVDERHDEASQDGGRPKPAVHGVGNAVVHGVVQGQKRSDLQAAVEPRTKAKTIPNASSKRDSNSSHSSSSICKYQKRYLKTILLFLVTYLSQMCSNIPFSNLSFQASTLPVSYGSSKPKRKKRKTIIPKSLKRKPSSSNVAAAASRSKRNDATDPAPKKRRRAENDDIRCPETVDDQPDDIFLEEPFDAGDARAANAGGGDAVGFGGELSGSVTSAPQDVSTGGQKERTPPSSSPIGDGGHGQGQTQEPQKSQERVFGENKMNYEGL
jgi:hypothetical protein